MSMVRKTIRGRLDAMPMKSYMIALAKATVQQDAGVRTQVTVTNLTKDDEYIKTAAP